MIDFRSGDLLKAKEAYIAQGVAEGNQEGLGTGLALKISTRWPEIQSEFKRYARLGRFRAGDIFVVPPTNSTPGVIYLATQPDIYYAKICGLRRLRCRARYRGENLISNICFLGLISRIVPLRRVI